MKNKLFLPSRVSFAKLLCGVLSTFIFWALPCDGFSDTYFYELYLHNEYYSEPAGFPSKFIIAPLIASLSNTTKGSWEKRFSAGAIGSLRLTHNHAWIECITAFERERVRFNHEGKQGKKARNGFDDFLIDIGYNFLLDEKGKIQLLVHWLTGIPTYWKVSLAEIEDPLCGTRTIATGPVLEFAYDFIRNQKRDLFIGFIGRFLYRFKRSYQPILPANALFNPGYDIDLLALIHYRFRRHNWEVGYIPSFLINRSYEFPKHIEFLPSQQLNSIYIDYCYYHDQLAMGFDANITKIWGKKSQGTVLSGSVSWYF